MAEKQSTFEVLMGVNVNDKKEQKNNLDYLSWAWAWIELHKRFPEATSKVYETPEGINYWNDGRTAWVKVGVTIEGLEHIEYLPVMDFRNKSIPLEKVTSADVNKAIQRGLTKAIARHGLALYIYAGEDLPELTEEQQQAEMAKKQEQQKQFQEEIEKQKEKIDKLETSAAVKKYWQMLPKDLKQATKEFVTKKGQTLKLLEDKSSGEVEELFPPEKVKA